MSAESVTDKRVLLIASVASMIDQFNMSNIRILKEIGYEVDVACNFVQGSTCSYERVKVIKENLDQLGVRYFHIDFCRNAGNVAAISKAYQQLDKLFKENDYSFVHCHSPIGGLLGRCAASRHRVKTIYTAHGFHFFEGAPKKNWMVYYPIELEMSKRTDVLITINKEDYSVAEKKLKAKRTEYVPGIGINLRKFGIALSEEERKIKRESLGIPQDAFLVVSVGELNDNKNHESVIKAISALGTKSSICYLIVGQGHKKIELDELACSRNVNLIMPGYRDDVPQIYQLADVYIHPSYREGMSVALMEAVASKTLVLASGIRGNTDIIAEDCLFAPSDVDAITTKLNEVMSGGHRSSIEENYERIKEYSCEHVDMIMRDIYIGM